MIVVGAKVTSLYGAGQPKISGTVESIERDQARIRLRNGVLRTRSLRNLRVL